MAGFMCNGQLWARVSVLFVVFAVALAQKTILRNPMAVSDQCRVSEKIRCGDAVTSGSTCEALNCCFDGEQCYYARKITVQCTRDGQFVIVVAKDSTMPALDLSTVTFLGGRDEPCCPVAVTDAFAIYKFPVTACGTRTKDEGGYLVYKNLLSAAYLTPSASRGSAIHRFSFQCKYEAVTKVATLQPMVGSGLLNVELRLGNGQCDMTGCEGAYTSYYKASDYPVMKVLHQPVYVEVSIRGRTDPNLVLLLDHCWATSSPDSLSQPQWSLLVDGCPYQGDKYLTSLVPVTGSSGLLFPTHYKRFIVRMFTFVDPTSQLLQEKVFIHCSTAVCLRSATENCEQRCYRKGRDVSAVQKQSYSEPYVSSGELILVAP